MKRSVERRYGAALGHLMQGLQTELSRLRSPFLMAAAIRRYARSPTYRQAAEAIARSMATHVFLAGHKTWRQAAKAGSKGRTVYNALQKELQATQVGVTYERIIMDNAHWIQTMPETIANRVAAKVAREAEEGKRPEEIVDEVLQLYPRMTRAHAKLIARTETSKASTALTEARCASAGIHWYIWRSSEDERVRSAHRLMDGLIISWDEPASPERLAREPVTHGLYHPGNIFNCRCYPQALITFDDVSWPHKVYRNGRVQTMTLAQFKRIAGGEL